MNAELGGSGWLGIRAFGLEGKGGERPREKRVREMGGGHEAGELPARPRRVFRATPRLTDDTPEAREVRWGTYETATRSKWHFRKVAQ